MRIVRSVDKEDATRRVSAALSEALSAKGAPTQAELAEAVGVSQSAVSLWKRGEALPSIVQLVLIDDALGWPRGHLLRIAGIIDRMPISAWLRADPGLDHESVGVMLATYDEQIAATAKRRARAAFEDMPTEPVPAVIIEGEDQASVPVSREEIIQLVEDIVRQRMPPRGPRSPWERNHRD